MPTRTGTKPTSYTYNGSAIAGWLFNPDEISGGVISDITGNGVDLTLQGTAATESTDATHGDCLRGNGSGASRDPGAAFDSLGDYSFFVSLFCEDNTNLSGSSENIFILEDTTSSFDSASLFWTTAENAHLRIEDDNTSNVDTIIADAIENNASEWITIGFSVDATAGTIDLYVCVDGETTQTQQSTSTGISGTTSVNNLLTLVDGWHALCECAFFYDSTMSQATFEAFHVDPYTDFSAGGAVTSLVYNPNPMRVHLTQ